MNLAIAGLNIRQTPGAIVSQLGEGYWRLELPPGTAHSYRLAQLDDHAKSGRSDFEHTPPLTLSLQARVSAQDLPGTWGFGFWNEPFGFLLSLGAQPLRLPSLPQAAWFFHASAQNYLSFRDDLPACGFLAATFRSRLVPSLLLVLGSPLLGFTLLSTTTQFVRRLIRRLVRQDTALVDLAVTEWHDYQLRWEIGSVKFSVDNEEIFDTKVAPQAPLSLVIWIDNQYAALPSTGRLRYGYLPNSEPAWMEVRQIDYLVQA